MRFVELRIGYPVGAVEKEDVVLKVSQVMSSFVMLEEEIPLMADRGEISPMLFEQLRELCQLWLQTIEDRVWELDDLCQFAAELKETADILANETDTERMRGLSKLISDNLGNVGILPCEKCQRSRVSLTACQKGGQQVASQTHQQEDEQVAADFLSRILGQGFQKKSD